MDINILKDYINYCNSLNIEPTFKGLRDFRDNRIGRPWRFEVTDYLNGTRSQPYYTRRR